MRRALLAIAVVTFICCTGNTSQQTLTRIEAVSFPQLGETLFIMPRAWGLAGNHEQILIKTDSTKRAYDKEQDYAFVSDEIYYRHTSDSLVIYAPSDAIMPLATQWQGKVVVSCNGLLGYDKVMEYRKDYAQYGLQRVSIYP